MSSTFLVFHGASAAGELLALTQGVSEAIWVNVGVRIVVAGLFAYLGVYRMSRAGRSTS